MNLSYSLVSSLLEGCPWSVALDRIVKAPVVHSDSPRTIAGSALHLALELNEQERLDWHRSKGSKGSKNGLRRFSLEAEIEWAVSASGFPFESRSDMVACTDEALNGLAHFYETPIPEGQIGEGRTIHELVSSWRPLAVERRFETYDPEVRGRAVVGSADAVYLDDHEEVVVADWKSATNLGRYSLDGGFQRLQGATYSRAVVEAINLPGSKALGYWPTALFFIMRTQPGKNKNFQGVRVVAIEPTNSDMRALDERYRAAEAIIEEGIFPKDPEAAGVLCRDYCPHNVSKGGTCWPQAPQEFDLREFL